MSPQEGEHFPKAFHIVIGRVITELLGAVIIDFSQIGAGGACQPKPDCAVPAAPP
ncbi:MAG: hypothetical protein LKF30_13500 [Sphingobium sp.]|jgi:hypothetical protein|nr:hypothetical protein [Sphingobium sp.]